MKNRFLERVKFLKKEKDRLQNNVKRYRLAEGGYAHIVALEEVKATLNLNIELYNIFGLEENNVKQALT